MALHLSQDTEADQLLSSSPLALLIGMVLDQQVPLEWAFSAPLELSRRLDTELDAAELAAMEPDSLIACFTQRPALHRYPGAMAKRVQDLCRQLVEQYDGRADAVWQDVSSGTELFERVRRLPGFGEQKARIFVAFLGKQLGVRPSGWAEVSAPFSDQASFRSVADIVDETTLQKVRSFKQDMKASAKAAPKPASKAARKAAPKPASKAAPKPASKAAAKPASKAAAKPASKPARKAASRP